VGSHLIAKKVGGLKCSTQVNLKASSMLPVFFTLVFCFSIQPSLHTHKKKKKKTLGANFGSKDLICAKKNFEN
jgi:hypothetical protein